MQVQPFENQKITPYTSLDHIINANLYKGKWTDEEDWDLMYAIKLYGERWDQIRDYFKKLFPQRPFCPHTRYYYRYKNYLKKSFTIKDIQNMTFQKLSESFKKIKALSLNLEGKKRVSRFTLLDDEKLLNGIKEFGENWKSIAKHQFKASEDKVSTIAGRCYDRYRKYWQSRISIQKILGIIGSIKVIRQYKDRKIVIESIPLLNINSTEKNKQINSQNLPHQAIEHEEFLKPQLAILSPVSSTQTYNPINISPQLLQNSENEPTLFGPFFDTNSPFPTIEKNIDSSPSKTQLFFLSPYAITSFSYDYCTFKENLPQNLGKMNSSIQPVFDIYNSENRRTVEYPQSPFSLTHDFINPSCPEINISNIDNFLVNEIPDFDQIFK